MTWFVYLLWCADETLYTGITTDVERRVSEHNAGPPLGARYTRTRRPVRLVHVENAASRSAAAKRERAIKRKSRTWKLALIAANQSTLTPVQPGYDRVVWPDT